MAKNFKVRSNLSFMPKNSHLKKDYKTTVFDGTFISNISKIQTIPWQNEGVMVLSKKSSQWREQPGIVSIAMDVSTRMQRILKLDFLLCLSNSISFTEILILVINEKKQTLDRKCEKCFARDQILNSQLFFTFCRNSTEWT